MGTVDKVVNTADSIRRNGPNRCADCQSCCQTTDLRKALQVHKNLHILCSEINICAEKDLYLTHRSNKAAFMLRGFFCWRNRYVGNYIQRALTSFCKKI